jgi:hypothetical protein
MISVRENKAFMEIKTIIIIMLHGKYRRISKGEIIETGIFLSYGMRYTKVTKL